jgi:5'-methylthioadenosine nucleosidase
MEFNPDLVLSAGTAGGFKRVGATIGDSFIGTSFVHHDRRIPIPSFDAYGRGLRQGPSCEKLIKDLGLKSGVVSSGNSLDHCPDDDKIMEEVNAAVKEMEVASIAYVCEHASVPLLALKVVTDIVDGDRPSHEEFLENLHTASHSLQEQLPRMVSYLLGKKLADL